ncbi:MAG: BON domain-containing protein [Hyphomonas sp.]
MRAPLLLLPLIALLPLTNCAVAAVGAVGAAGFAASKDQTVGQTIDDIGASNEIKARLLSESSSRFNEVAVEVAQGLVLLTGRVYSAEDRTRAEGIAWTSVYTQDVANELAIEQPGGFFANVADEIISGRVRSRLIGSSKVKSININVETYNGVVYLMGIARTPEEMRRAAEEASLVGGVKQVVSYVRLSSEAQRQPAPTTQVPVSPSYQSQPDTSYDSQPLPELRGANY